MRNRGGRGSDVVHMCKHRARPGGICSDVVRPLAFCSCDEACHGRICEGAFSSFLERRSRVTQCLLGHVRPHGILFNNNVLLFSAGVPFPATCVLPTL